MTAIHVLLEATVYLPIAPTVCNKLPANGKSLNLHIKDFTHNFPIVVAYGQVYKA